MADPDMDKPVEAQSETSQAPETPKDDPCDLTTPDQGQVKGTIPAQDTSEPGLSTGDPPEAAELGLDAEQEQPKAECKTQAETTNASEAPPIFAPIDVLDANWEVIYSRAFKPEQLLQMPDIVQPLESLLDEPEGRELLFDGDRSDPADRAIKISAEQPLWFVGDLHGDLLALEAALALIERETEPSGDKAGIVFLGDLFDDGGLALALLLRIYQLIIDDPHRVCLVAGNHDEALRFEDGRFTSSVDPSDFAEYLNEHLADQWTTRAGRLAIRLAEKAPRALFFPDGLLVAHGGFPLVDLHEKLRETEDWNDPQVLEDFVWTRAHPKARKKLPNRYSRGSQYGYEDFAAFCALSTELGRPVSHMIRGHDHVDDRYAIYGSNRLNPILTTVALSRRLSREGTGDHARVPTIARFVSGALPQVYRLHIPADAIEGLYPEHQHDKTEDQGS